MNAAHLIWGPATLLEIACIVWVIASDGAWWGFIIPVFCLAFCLLRWRQSFIQEREHKAWMARWSA